MFRKNFFDILMVKASLPEKQVIKLAECFSQFGKYELSEDDRNALFQSRILATTPMTKIFQRLVEDGVQEKFTLFSLKGIKENIPEQLTYRHICYDTLQMEKAIPKITTILRLYPSINQKLLMNVTTLAKDTPSGHILRDSTAFQNLVVRDILCRSFYQSGGHKLNWISPNVDQHLAKIYGLLISTNVSRHFSLDQQTQKFIYTAFLLYMLGQVGNTEIARSTLSVKSRYFYFASSHEVESFCDEVAAKIGKPCPETLDEAMDAVNALGINRLVLTRQHLGMKLRSISTDLLSSVFSLEYPPYFLWSCLAAVSGAKTGLSIFLKQQNLHKDLLLTCNEVCKSANLNLLDYTL